MARVMQTAGEGIRNIGALADQLKEHLERTISVCHDVAGQWERLGKLGGQRDDHAAHLLALVKVQTMAVKALVDRVDSTLDRLILDAFGDGPQQKEWTAEQILKREG